MAGSNDSSLAEDFYLCGAVESFMINELDRGYGEHTNLGWVYHHRSSIQLLESQSFLSLSRVVTPGSSLAAKYDVVNLFRAADRGYVDQFVSGSQIIDEETSTNVEESFGTENIDDADQIDVRYNLNDDAISE
jgi:hypothetical protein